MEGSFDNIKRALGQSQSEGLSYQQQSDNYTAFSDLMKQGVYIPDLLKRIDALEAQVREQGAKKDTLDADLFAVMETAVKGDEDVRKTRQRLADEKTRVITELCFRDEGYRQASEAYRRAVNSAYIRSKEDSSVNPT